MCFNKSFSWLMPQPKASKTSGKSSDSSGHQTPIASCTRGQLHKQSFSSETKRLAVDMGQPTAFDVRKVAILGAGPSGIAAAKHLLAGLESVRVDIFEQQAEVGGVWNYNASSSDDYSIPQTSPDRPLDKPTWPNDRGPPIFSNPMYDDLHTNIMKTLMCFSDMDFPSPSLLFPTRQDIQQYLVEYSSAVKSFIRFSTQVQNIQLDAESGRDRWEVTWKSFITNETQRSTYDAVVVASGRYAVPFIPDVPGIKVFHGAYPSIISHSKSFRKPESFIGKKVVVVGNSASGTDIGSQISQVCRRPLLNSVRSPSEFDTQDQFKEEVPIITEYIPQDRSIIFENGRIEKDVDAVVYCTGYMFSYPHLTTLKPPLVTDGQRVRGLYQQVFNIKHPTLAFLALPYKVVPFPLADVQSAAIARLWANRTQLPSERDMALAEKRQIEELGDGRGFHMLEYPRDAKYINKLYDWVMSANPGPGKKCVSWGQKDLWMRKNNLIIRAHFRKEGSTAKTMEELGFHYEDEPDEAARRTD